MWQAALSSWLDFVMGSDMHLFLFHLNKLFTLEYYSTYRKVVKRVYRASTCASPRLSYC